MNCPDENRLSSYLDKRLSEEERCEIEQHIAECRQCLDLLVVASKTQKSRGGLNLPYFSRSFRNDKKRNEMKWLVGALILFTLSFVLKRYFLQFLAGAIILGFKWVMEGEGARRAIMIFKGIEPKEKEKKFERKQTPPVSNITGGDRYGEGE